MTYLILLSGPRLQQVDLSSDVVELGVNQVVSDFAEAG